MTDFPPMVGWTLKIESIGTPGDPTTTRTVYWWSGTGNITIDGDVYQGVTNEGVAFMDVSAIEQSQGPPIKRATVRMAVVPEMERRILQQDYGPIPITVGFVRSSDGGRTWLKINRSFPGRLSSPKLIDGLYEAEIETVLGDVDRGVPLRWSYEAQIDRHSDKFFEAVNSYASGFEHKWPQ